MNSKFKKIASPNIQRLSVYTVLGTLITMHYSYMDVEYICLSIQEGVACLLLFIAFHETALRTQTQRE